MTKLDRTKKNKIIVTASVLAGMAFLGYLAGKGPDKKLFAMGGAVVGLMALPGISSWVMKPQINK